MARRARASPSQLSALRPSAATASANVREAARASVAMSFWAASLRSVALRPEGFQCSLM
jgi:hypothetical protein